MHHKKTSVKSIGAVLCALLLTFALAGCGAATTSSISDASGNSASSSSAAEEQEPNSASGELSSDEQPVEFTAKLTYVNLEYIETGDESVGKLVRNVSQTLTSDSTNENDRIEAVTEALRTVPSDLSGENAETMVNDNFRINFVKISGSNAVVDLSGKELDNIGDMDAEMFIYQVTDSILNTFSDIDGVRFTVDGTNTDDLSGIDISSPFTKSMVTEFAGTSSSSESSESGTSGGTVTEQSTGGSSSGASDNSGVVDDADQTGSDTASDGVVND